MPAKVPMPMIAVAFAIVPGTIAQWRAWSRLSC
jgi:hypothetical protein